MSTSATAGTAAASRGSGRISCFATAMDAASGWLDLLQWPAMLVTLTASWLVASKSRQRRYAGFWVFLVSNVLWVAWALSARAWALLALQVGLAAMNIRGERRNQRDS